MKDHEKNKNVSYIGLKLNRKTDADILDAIGEPDVRQQNIKSLVRTGVRELEYKQGGEIIDTNG